MSVAVDSDRAAEVLGNGKVRITYYSAGAGQIMVCRICRPERRNAVDRETADALYDIFVRFANDTALSVAILTGSDGQFCAGADLKAIMQGTQKANHASTASHRLDTNMDAPGPMGVSRLVMNKPVIAAISGYAVAGGLELAAWCDLRVACGQTAQLGVLCRLRGVPLIDGGTVRLPALLGLSRATDLILTGRLVDATEALALGLVNYIVPHGGEQAVLDKALEVAAGLCAHPRTCMLNDRASMLASVYGLDTAQASSQPDLRLHGRMRQEMQREFELGLQSLAVLESEGAVSAFVNKKASHM